MIVGRGKGEGEGSKEKESVSQSKYLVLGNMNLSPFIPFMRCRALLRRVGCGRDEN